MGATFQKELTVSENIRRICDNEIENIILDHKSEDINLNKTIHYSRKHCKNIRGLLRFIAPVFKGDYKYEDAWYRDCAKILSNLRDTQSVLEAYDKLVEEGEREKFQTIYDKLESGHQQTANQDNALEKAVEEFLKRIEEGRERIKEWEFRKKGFKVIAKGLEKTYKGCYNKMNNSYANPIEENFHDWRKQVKYHKFHMILLSFLSKDLEKRVKIVDSLAEDLGDDHDLYVLKHKIGEDRNSYGEEAVMSEFLELVEQKQKKLKEAARKKGKKLYKEDSSLLMEKIEKQWNRWIKK